ncbi:unnamed protein product [Brassica oleracea]
MRVWTLSASSIVRRIAKDPVDSIFFQLVRLDFRGCDGNWSNLLMHVLRHSPLLQTLNLVVLYYGLSNWNLERGVKVRWIQPS